MDASLYYPSFRIFSSNISAPGNIYSTGEPTEEGVVMYSIVTPIICVFGIIGNSLSLIVLSRRELKGSVYVYLSAFVDLCGCILLFLSGLSCGVFFMESNWPVYDILLGLPLATMFNTMGVLTTVMVTFDRICYLANPMRRSKPRFCHVCVARRTMLVCFLISILSSIPHTFIFSSHGKREVETRPFYYSDFYKAYTWIRFVLLGVLPSIFLTFGNGYLIYALHKVKKIYGKCNESVKCKKPRNYTNLTVTLILIVFLFLLSQIPTILISRTSTSTFFYEGVLDEDSDNSKYLETVREISTVINAISLSSDFLLYYLFCPPFCKVMEKLFSRKKKCKSVQMRVFVIDKQICFENNGKSIKEIAAGKLFQVIETENNRDSLRSSVYDGSVDKCDKDETKPNRDTLITLCSNTTD